jgi:hypothetical protein
MSLLLLRSILVEYIFSSRRRKTCRRVASFCGGDSHYLPRFGSDLTNDDVTDFEGTDSCTRTTFTTIKDRIQ